MQKTTVPRKVRQPARRRNTFDRWPLKHGGDRHKALRGKAPFSAHDVFYNVAQPGRICRWRHHLRNTGGSVQKSGCNILELGLFLLKSAINSNEIHGETG